MQFPEWLRALNHRDFRLFLSGQAISQMGSWMQSVGQAWLVLELTDSPFKLGLIGTLQFAPVLLFSLVAGAVIDRLPKRRVIVTTQVILMLLAFALAALILTGHVQYWHVVVLAVLFGVTSTFDMPARQSFIAEMAGKEDLTNAIALNSGIFNAARIVGPAVAGLLIAGYGVGWAFLLNGVSFMPVIGALLAVRAEGLPRPGRAQTMLRDIRAGVHYALRTPRVALLLSMLLAVSLFCMNFRVLVPLLARNALHLEARGFGLLMAAMGIGAVVGAVVLAAVGRGRLPLTTVLTSGLLLCAFTLAIAAIEQVGVIAALLFAAGLVQLLFTVGCNSTLQMTVPDELRGRVMSMYIMVFGGVTPFGSFFSGAVAETFGVRAAYLAGGGLGMISVLALLVWWWRTSCGTPRAYLREPG